MKSAHDIFFTLPAPTFDYKPKRFVTPKRKVISNIPDVDTALWARALAATGNSACLSQAEGLLAEILTRVDKAVLQKAYMQWRVNSCGGSAFEAMDMHGLDNLYHFFNEAYEKEQYVIEYAKRYGDLCPTKIPHYVWWDGLMKGFKHNINANDPDVQKIYKANHCPVTLTECLLELSLWEHLATMCWKIGEEDCTPSSIHVREDCLELSLARIAPMWNEGEYVLEYLLDSEDRGRDRSLSDCKDILLNLISPRK